MDGAIFLCVLLLGVKPNDRVVLLFMGLHCLICSICGDVCHMHKHILGMVRILRRGNEADFAHDSGQDHKDSQRLLVHVQNEVIAGPATPLQDPTCHQRRKGLQESIARDITERFVILSQLFSTAALAALDAAVLTISRNSSFVMFLSSLFVFV